MILVDIQVPMLDRTYDFELDEESGAELLMEDILELIAEQEGVRCRKGEKMYLYALDQEKVIEMDKNLRQQGVGDGSRLILI